MKRILITTLLALLAGTLNASPMNDGHQLTSLWRQYEEAHNADLPQQEADILAQIKQQAMAKHLPADFYDAATEYVNTVLRRDWTKRDELHAGLKKEVELFGEPIVTFLWMNEWQNASSDYLWKYVKEHPDGFSGLHPELHRNLYSYLGGRLKPFIRSDKEYVLWKLLPSRTYEKVENDEIYQALQKEIGGQYPNQAALEYHVIVNRYWYSYEMGKKRELLSNLVQKYAGKAAAVYPRAELLSMRMVDLEQQKASGSQFKTLYDAADKLQKEIEAYGGDEKYIATGCKYPKSLMETLTGKNVEVLVNRKDITVVFQNLPKAKVTLRNGKRKIQKWDVKNDVKSFYVKDSVSIPLPQLPDGSYSLEAVNGDYSDFTEYDQYTLSIASRKDSRGRNVYVTDYYTGEPLEAYTLRLMKGDKRVATTAMVQHGFTPLPEAFDKRIEKNTDVYYTVVAESGTRKSYPVNVERRTYGGYHPSTGTKCRIFLDRGAYNPGDTLQFKAVVFKGDPMLQMNVVTGQELKVTLRDSEGNILETSSLTTNEWGSVSGSFALPKGLRNGTFRLDVGDLAREYFPVDEFVLPTFELAFDPWKELYLTGDTVPLSGKVTSYSGHQLSGATVKLRVRRYGKVLLETEQPVVDNKFHFDIDAKDGGQYECNVTVVDATGETQEFTRIFYVGESLSVTISMKGADADFSFTDFDKNGKRVQWPVYYGNRYVVESREFEVNLQARDGSRNAVPLPVHYLLCTFEEKVVAEGETPSGTPVKFSVPGPGVYLLKTFVSAKKVDGKEITGKAECRILSIPKEETVLTPLARRVFVSGPLTLDDGQPIAVRIGSAEGPAYTVVTLYGKDRELLYMKELKVEDETVVPLELPYKADYPDAVRLQVFYFMDGQTVEYDRQYRRAKTRITVPLNFTRFEDKTYPGVQYSFALQTAPGVEALAGVWDKSLDAIRANSWPLVTQLDYSVEAVNVNTACGGIFGTGDRPRFYGYAMESKAAGGKALRRSKAGAAAGAVLEDNMVLASPMMADMAVEREAAVEEAEESGAPADDGVKARTDFANVLTFQPHLYSSTDGTLEFSFRTSDKLSTYYVSVYAHDKEMRNALVQQEMVVSLPVKVALVEPKFLFVGDVYEAAVSVSSIVDEPVEGMMVLRAGDSVQQLPVKVEPGATVSHRFKVEAPDVENITIKASFVAKEFTDAVQVEVPVYPAAQVLTEAHSAVLRAGMDREALLKELRGRFVNVPGSEAELREISVLDMVKDAIPEHAEPDGKDVLSLSEAWYIRLLAGRLGSEVPEDDLLDKIMACRNNDGGFGWFEGFDSNPSITAVILERMAKLRDRGFQVPDLSSSVKYLDKEQFATRRDLWRGWLSDDLYLHIRARYASVPFNVVPVTVADRKRMDDFKDWAKDYLTPSKKAGRGLQGQILAKARRLLTLRNLAASDEGIALAKKWGVGIGAKSKMESSIAADVQSLLEYAVEHRDGGWYYPNAVMPFRGLMASEAYAHTLLCELLQGDNATITDGIRLWLMLQKETQKWDTDAAYVDAITCILDGSEALLSTRVLALSATYRAPFQQIKAAGNGFTIERKFFKEVTVEREYDDKTGPNDKVTQLVELKGGEALQVGDKILVEYNIFNAENRSFVRIKAGREAALRPVEQLSGHIGYGYIRPLRRGWQWSFTPQGYRNVKAEATEYYFDSYPEQKTQITERFYVIQAGTFQAPVTEIESLYAPHYRANSGCRKPLQVTAK